MIKKPIALILILIMIFSLTACASSGGISGSGTEEDPWLCGATKDDDVRVFVVDNSLWINGDGRMMDFENLADRPWNDISDDIRGVNIFDGLRYVGKNAFKGIGTNSDYVDLFLGEGIGAIGESAFEGTKFSYDFDGTRSGAIITIPDSVQSIGPRAFADSGVCEVYFDGAPEVSDDAFAGNTCTVYIRNNADFERLPYGGELSYKTLYAFNYIEDYGTDEISGDGTMYIPEDGCELYIAQDYVGDENYGFVRYEVLDGDFEIEDPTNPELQIQLTGDVQVKIIYAKVVE